MSRPARLALLLASFAVVSYGACVATRYVTRPPATARPDAPLPRRPLASLEPTGDEDPSTRLFESFDAMGSVDLTMFEGVYAYDGRVGSFPGLVVEENALRFGAVFRSEINPVREIARDGDELLAEAVYHEDVDDPGDAQSMYVLLRRERDGGLTVAASMDDALWEVGRQERLVSIARESPGPEFRPSVASFDVPRGFYEPEPCVGSGDVGVRGAFVLDPTAFPASGDLFDRNLRDAAYVLWVGRLVIDVGRFTIANSADRGRCFRAVTPDGANGSVAVIRATSIEGDEQEFRVRVTPTVDGVVLRFASAGRSLDAALPLTYRRATPRVP